MIKIEVFTINEYRTYLEKYGKNNFFIAEKSAKYKIEEVKNLHVKIFRKLLSDKKEAIQIINSILEKTKLEPKDIEQYNSSFISEDLRNSEADIVYKQKDKDIYYLIEHQTYIDYSMPYRILNYEKEILDAALKERGILSKGKLNLNKKDFEYPLIMSTVLYTGNKKWNPELDLRKVQVKFDKYKGKEFSKYNIYDINTISTKELLKRNTLMNKMFVIEKSKDKTELEKNLNIVAESRLNKEDRKFFSKIIKYGFIKELGEEKTQELINKIWKGGERQMLAVQQMIHREFKQTREEGKKVGRQETRIEIAKKMLNKKVAVKDILEFTGLKKEEIEKLK